MDQRADNSIVPAENRSDVVLLGPSSYPPIKDEAPPPNILKLLHGSLRGRYPLVIVLALIATISCGLAGYFMGHPMYRAEAIIRIHPRLPKILYNVDEDTMGSTFNAFVSTQAALVQQDRVINAAVNSDQWRALGRGNLPADVSAFRRALTATTSREAPELISVTFTDREAKAAKVGLDLVLASYDEIFGDGGAKFKNLRRTTLESMQATASKAIASLREDIRQTAAEYGTDDLTQLHAMQMQQLINVGEHIRELRLAIAERAPAPSGQPSATQTEPPRNASPEQIAAVDRLMDDYLSQRRHLDANITSLKSQGFGTSHPAYKQAQSDIDALNGVIAEYARMWNANREIRVPASPETGAAAGAGESVEQLQARLNRLVALEDGARSEAVAIGNKRLAIEAKMRQIADNQAKLDEATKKLEEIDVESKVEQTIGKIEIIPPDSVPSAPTVDSRKKLAVLGAGAGGGFVVGLAFLLGLIDRRCRYSDEVNQTVDGKLLACLPVMARSTGTEEALAAVHSLHRVRALMQIVSSDQRTIAVTSANAGDGKTSLCLSLGISFAGVGHRTLLIDLDLVGHGLSSRMRMCDGPGILDALTAGTPEGFARSCHVPGLFVLPVGAGVDASPAKLRRPEIETLVRRAASLFDTVLVDTGPLLGSLEANFVCSSADAVLLVVGRGQSRTLVRRAVQHIRDINARLLGVVFNRANNQDFRSSSVSASFRSVRTSRPWAASDAHPVEGAGIDPLADAVFVDGQSYQNSANAGSEEAAAPAA